MADTADVAEIRRKNLRLLVTEHEGMQSLANKLGMKKGSYISQLLMDPPKRGIGERSARNFEKTLGLGRGWMDEPHDAYGKPVRKAEGLNETLLREVLTEILTGLQKAKVTLAADKPADLIALQYLDGLPNGHADKQRIETLINLLKK